MKIPIYNLYMMLLYVWDHTTAEDKSFIEGINVNTPADLLVCILNKATRALFKRGLNRSYVPSVENIRGIRGKLLFSKSLKTAKLEQGQTVCLIDSFNIDIVHNQIIKSTLSLVRKSKNIDKKLRMEASQLRNKFHQIQEIGLSRKFFKRVTIHRNNRMYRLLLHVCELIFLSLRPAEQPGTYEFIDFTQDQIRFEILYEKFLLNFYKRHSDWLTHSPRIKWQDTEVIQKNDGNEFLPQLWTDIVLRKKNQAQIIDAKFYSKTLSVHYGTERVHRTHLNQMYVYIQNFARHPDYQNLTIEGMLLYPEIDKQLRWEKRIHGNRVRFYTVNLNQPWMTIQDELLSFI